MASYYRTGELVAATAIPIKLDGKDEPICWVIKRKGESEDMFVRRASHLASLLNITSQEVYSYG